MRKKNLAKFGLLYLGLLLVAISLASFFSYGHFKGTGNKTQLLAETPTAVQATGVNNDETITASQKTVKNINDLSDLKIPVLMYHYIRTLNDPADQIGTNLSVDPAKFAEQLDLIKSRGYTAINFQDLLTGKLPEKPIILTFDDGYNDFYTAAYPALKVRGMTATSFVITGKIGDGNYMIENQIKELSDNGIEIGSHTIAHPDLSKLTTAKATKEITESRQMLEKIIGGSVVSFCYPSGKYNVETEKIVKDSGYSFAVTTNGGVTTFADTFALNRYRVNHDTNIGSFIK